MSVDSIAINNNNNKSLTTIVGPLNFAENSQHVKLIKLNETSIVNCLFCDLQYKFNEEVNECLAHLFLKHRFVIGEIQQICSLPEYLHYWRQKFQGIFLLLFFFLIFSKT